MLSCITLTVVLCDAVVACVKTVWLVMGGAVNWLLDLGMLTQRSLLLLLLLVVRLSTWKYKVT